MLVMAWLPPIYVKRGESAQTVGYLLASLTFVEALAALGLAAFIHHFADRGGPLVTRLVLVLAGLACLLVQPIALAIPAVFLLGAGIGILFHSRSLWLSITSRIRRSPETLSPSSREVAMLSQA